MEEENYSLYRHSFPNGKVYIGITKNRPEQRWANGRGYSSVKKVREAIKKYGWNNAKHEVLKSNLTKKEAEKAERDEISKYSEKDLLNTCFVRNRNVVRRHPWLKDNGTFQYEMPKQLHDKLYAMFGPCGTFYRVFYDKIQILVTKQTNEWFMTFDVIADCNCKEMSLEEFNDWIKTDFPFRIENFQIETIEKFKKDVELLSETVHHHARGTTG